MSNPMEPVYTEVVATIDGIEYDHTIFVDDDDDSFALAMEFVRDWKAMEPSFTESGRHMVAALTQYSHYHPVEWEGECICRQYDLAAPEPFWTDAPKHSCIECENDHPENCALGEDMPEPYRKPTAWEMWCGLWDIIRGRR